MREAWAGRQFGRAATAAPMAFVPDFPAAPNFAIAVDLRCDMFSRRWWRGLATLTTMAGALALTTPGLEPLPGGTPAKADAAGREQWRASGIGPQASGSKSGLRMTATGRVQPIGQAPERASIDLFVRLASDGPARGLERLGASPSDAGAVQDLLRSAGVRLRPGTAMAVRLGRRQASGRRPIEQIAMAAGIDLRLVIARGGDGFTLTRIPIAVDRTPIRIRGRAGDGLYWALRTAGASPDAAADYLKALAGKIDVGEIGPDDRFDLILANRRSATGESQAGTPLYAGLDRAADGDVQLIRWQARGKMVWVDAAEPAQAPTSNAMLWPVAGRITSRFGPRRHPILRFQRMHRGIDFGAGHGTPILAAADGQIIKAGWAGGYGRQVRIAHGGGLATSYSHMSRMIVDPGALVRQGQVIGYVGSSGLSTGPHLHYEVHRRGAAVDPMSVRFAGAPGVDPAVGKAIKARLAQLLKVGAKP